MSRWSQHAEDSRRLPEGFQRIGYDADTMQYTFTDTHGKLYRSAPGEEYGTLTPVAASTDRPGAFSDGENPKANNSSTSGPAPKLTFSDFLPTSAMTSASSSPDQNLPAPSQRYFNGAVQNALPKIWGVIQNLHRTSAYTKESASADHTQASSPHDGGKSSTPNMSNTADASPASIVRVDKSKSSGSEPKA
ncbi:uncharacterized protein EV420DRAFT_883166 [Desarmillaria tabescens]|uniref:Uncharacterized protein n=1 Tax=Armillaria tabescens TaxID=1929756 RepID=A0AA39MV45_ARMTA|nr:uncharacterized protein EV420DRAFT_883166 [Desarmillaria tabescens]KAK0446960.1 hypothetical protein EV420DRAFT_883166 [Desarmillaria tabescens]